MIRQWSRAVCMMLLCALVLVGCAYGKSMRQGDEAFAAGNYAEALAHYEAAAKVDPGSEEIKSKIAETKEKMVEESATAARAALDGGDLLGAMAKAREAWDLMPEAQTTVAVVAEVSTATMSRADDLTREKDYANSLMLYEALAEKLPSETERATPRAGEVRTLWSALLVERANAAQQAGRKGDEMLQWAKIAQLNADPAAASNRERLRAEILADWSYWVALSGKRNGAYDHVAGALSTLAIAPGLRVATKLPSGQKVSANGVLKVGKEKFTQDRTDRSETAQYQSGTKTVENPFYKTKQDRVLDEEGRLVDAQNEVTKLENDVMRYEEAVTKEGDTPNVTTGAEQNLSNARSRLESARRRVADQRTAVQRAKEELAREPATKEEPIFSQHTYTVTTHTLRGELSVGLSLKHADGRPALKLDEFANVEVRDDAHPPQDIASIPENTLELPSKEELTGQLRGAAVQMTGAVITSSFGQWREALADRAVTAATDDERVDLMVIYIITDPRNVSPKVPADLSALRGIPDSVAVLSAGN